MPEEPSSDESGKARLLGWMQTVPGFLTALAAVITAVTGLIVAVYQIRDFQTSASSRPEHASPARPGEARNNGEAPASSGSPASQTPSGNGAAQKAMALPAGMEVKLRGGDIVYKILSARLEPYNAEKRTLRFTIRCTNNGLAAMNFWDSSFRLLLNGGSRAPISDLNELVDARSVEEGDIVFEVPASERKVVLQISAPTASGYERTKIPFDLSAAKP